MRGHGVCRKVDFFFGPSFFFISPWNLLNGPEQFSRVPNHQEKPIEHTLVCFGAMGGLHIYTSKSGNAMVRSVQFASLLAYVAVAHGQELVLQSKAPNEKVNTKSNPLPRARVFRCGNGDPSLQLWSLGMPEDGFFFNSATQK